MKMTIHTLLGSALLLVLAPTVGSTLTSCSSCGARHGDEIIIGEGEAPASSQGDVVVITEGYADEDIEGDAWENAADTLALPVEPTLRGSGQRIPIYLQGSLREIFNDSNRYHYQYAENLGIKPIRTLDDAYHTSRPLVRIVSCDVYEVDTLKHSLPFLVPEAAALLRDVGRAFRDSLARRGGAGLHKIKVTSLLRTPSSVKRLRRVNVNATDSSTHQFGTTFDISYTRFPSSDTINTVYDGDLKNLLGEVLLDMRSRGRCLVKFERRTPCFHITAIK